jgi:Flp pilus assembly pilin Flp
VSKLVLRFLKDKYGLIAVGIAIAIIAALQLTGSVVTVEFNRW